MKGALSADKIACKQRSFLLLARQKNAHLKNRCSRYKYYTVIWLCKAA